MIYFLADDHYQARPGEALYEILKDRYPISFYKSNPSGITTPAFASCDLLILNMIAGTDGPELPGEEVEKALLAHVQAARPLLLLHGASAAFWHWEWWRKMVGFRWVRNNDPDGTAPSVHPTRPYKVEVAKCRHPLAQKLQPMSFPSDEIYIQLEQTSPTVTLLETTTEEGTFPQCWETINPWGGHVIGFLPGHRSEVVTHPDAVRNVFVLIDYLRAHS